MESTDRFHVNGSNIVIHLATGELTMPIPIFRQIRPGRGQFCTFMFALAGGVLHFDDGTKIDYLAALAAL